MSKPRGGNRPSRSVDIANRTLKEYAEAQRRREQWTKNEALRSMETVWENAPGTRAQGKEER